jgi:hypothetical protein
LTSILVYAFPPGEEPLLSGAFVFITHHQENIMRQSEINRRVARATGESVATIRRLGFLLAEPTTVILDPDDDSLGGHVLDWDAHDDFRHTAPSRPGR